MPTIYGAYLLHTLLPGFRKCHVRGARKILRGRDQEGLVQTISFRQGLQKLWLPSQDLHKVSIPAWSGGDSPAPALAEKLQRVYGCWGREGEREGESVVSGVWPLIRSNYSVDIAPYPHIYAALTRLLGYLKNQKGQDTRLGWLR